jgi:ferredoxin
MSRAPRLKLDPTACNGVGLCAHLAPKLVALDSWGYPMISDAALRSANLRAAKRAVAGCPRKALLLAPDSGARRP